MAFSMGPKKNSCVHSAPSGRLQDPCGTLMRDLLPPSDMLDDRTLISA
eukprot:gene4943-3546_t